MLYNSRMKSLPQNLSFVDVETTGLSPERNRIIEIGIVRVENGKVVKQFNSLVDPGTHLPAEIISITGITTAELAGAPSFFSIKDQVKDLLEDSVFVAHNVNFDYGFVKNEFKRYETSFNAKTLCTVRLARRLFPHLGRFSLDSLIYHFDLEMRDRHRAFADAYALWDFYQKAFAKTEDEVFLEALNYQLKTSIPKNLKKIDIDNLHQGPGVYVFWGKQNGDSVILYIGKSVNVKKRVMQHFTSAKFTKKEARIFEEINHIEVIPTHGEIGALVRESDMIKRLSPIHNAVLRRKTEMHVLVKESINGYYAAKLTKINNINETNLESIIGVYKSKKQAQILLRDLAKNYNLCPKLLGLEKHNGKACFNSQLGNCFGACTKDEPDYKYNIRFIEAFSSQLVPKWPFEGEVEIREESKKGVEIHKINNWCYKGSRLYDEEGNEIDGLSENIFDWDIYKIIRRKLKGAY